MTNRPSVPEIITVNSEALQTQIRDLLPSQNGFGSELQASNVITPIIDLTAAAEGTTTPIGMQQALAFGSQTAFVTANTTDVLANSPGFYRIVGTLALRSSVGANISGEISMSDGSTTKAVWKGQTPINTDFAYMFSYDLIVFLRAGDSVSTISNNAYARMCGSIRQVADGSGALVDPTGYPL